MADLKSCPFCGGDAERNGDDYQFHCFSCGAMPPGANSLAEAAAIWNRRAPAPAAPQGVEVALRGYIERYALAHELSDLNEPDTITECAEARLALEAAIAAHVASKVESAIEELAQWFDEVDAGWHDGAEVAAAIRARGGTNV
jgi:Lar family restriction alleviation protein